MGKIWHLARFQFLAFQFSFYNLNRQMSEILLDLQQHWQQMATCFVALCVTINKNNRCIQNCLPHRSAAHRRTAGNAAVYNVYSGQNCAHVYSGQNCAQWVGAAFWYFGPPSYQLVPSVSHRSFPLCFTSWHTAVSHLAVCSQLYRWSSSTRV
jgi:hypothetical protein